MLLRLAWRNLWRNPRRTGLTAAAGVVGVVLTLFTLSLAAGSHERWIDYTVRLYPGHVEVSLDGYREYRTLDYGMRLSEQERLALDALRGVEGWAPRLESWALALPDRDDSVGRATWLVGVDPAREALVSRLGGSITSGHFLDGDDRAVVLGATLARNLGVSLGDSVILVASDYYGSQSADRFRVVGLISVGEPRMDAYVALVKLVDLQQFLEIPGGLSHVAVFAQESAETERVRASLDRIFDRSAYEILAWPDLIPDLVQFILLDDIGAYMMVAVLILVVAFGVLNTVLMSVFERVREFGVMRALGVRPRTVFALVLIESTLLSVVGIAIGLGIGLPLSEWLAENPIPLTGESAQAMEAFDIEAALFFGLTPRQLLVAPLVILGVSLVASLPPALRASRGRPVDALREV